MAVASRLLRPLYKFLVEESSLDGAGLAASGADGDAIGVGAELTGDPAAAGVGAAIGVGVGTKTVGMGEALIGGAAGASAGEATGVATWSNAVPVP